MKKTAMLAAADCAGRCRDGGKPIRCTYIADLKFASMVGHSWPKVGEFHPCYIKN